MPRGFSCSLPVVEVLAGTTRIVKIVWYMYGMKKTTVYLPDDLKRALARVAAQRQLSEAELLREAVGAITAAAEAPAPRLPLFRGKGPSIAAEIDKALKGFGQS